MFGTYESSTGTGVIVIVCCLYVIMQIHLHDGGVHYLNRHLTLANPNDVNI
jgi:hypothetical protein